MLHPQFNDKLRQALLSAGASEELWIQIVGRITELNRQITEDSQNLGRGYQIGHSFFCPLPGQLIDRDWYRGVIKHSVVPLLEEYWDDDEGRVKELAAWLLG